MRKLHFLLLAIWVVVTCAGCSPAQAPAQPPAASPTAALQPTAAPSLTPTPAVTPLPTLTPLPADRPGVLWVDTSAELGPVNPYVYGSNYGPWLFVTLDTMDEVQAAGLTYMRWPGGNWGDLNDVDAYQLDTFMAFCQNYKVEPAISVRMRGGSPEKAATVVKYLRDRGYKVRYWSIGNEPSLYKDYDTVRYNQEWRRFAEAMLAVDPDLILVGPDTHQFQADLAANPKDSAGRDWLVEFLKANGDLVDVISIHRYPFPAFAGAPAPMKADLRANSREWDAIIPALRALIREHTGHDLPVAVTEVNSSWAANRGGEATLESHYNAIWWADSLGRMIRQGTDIVAQFALVGDFGLMDKYDPYPIYYIYQLYQKFGQVRLAGGSGVADVSLYASRRSDGTTALMLVNLASAEKKVPLVIEDAPAQAGEAWLFDSEHRAEVVTVDEYYREGQITLPAESVFLLILEK